jgi:hypothetical protein
MLPSALSPALTKLAQRHILRMYNFTNLPLIGLIPFEILLRVRDPKTQSRWIEWLSTARYAYSITTMQQDWLLGRLLIPVGHTDDIHQWMKCLATHEEIASASIFKVTDLIDHWNFSAYTPGIGWIDDFSFIMEQTREQLQVTEPPHTDDFPSKYPYSYEIENRKPFKLHPEDFIYLRRAIDIVFTTDRIAPQVSQEIRSAGLSESVYRRRVQKLDEQNISKLGRLWLLHIGLDTVVQLFLFTPLDEAMNFTRALFNFPYLTGSIYEKENAKLRVFVPNLQAVEVLSFLRKLSLELELNVLIEAKPYWRVATGFQDPIKENNYDFTLNAWKWDELSLPRT